MVGLYWKIQYKTDYLGGPSFQETSVWQKKKTDRLPWF